MAMKLPRTIRLDPSDTFVYARAAEPGEWAVSGTFLFYGADPAGFSGKALQAFRGGFLGIDSFGWSTLVVVTEADEKEFDTAAERLAEGLVRHCGAPDLVSARAAAAEELRFAQSLCDHAPGTLLGLHRRAEGDSIRESFRTLHRRANRVEPFSAFQVIEVEGEEPAEDVSLVDLLNEGRR